MYRMAFRRPFSLFLLTAVLLQFANSRAVNISSVWLLPEEGFPVFYRYFRDRITWFEADAVCQFHHANLVTVDTSDQYDATRAYLKELDVMNNVWVGLKRSSSEGEFTWTDYKPLENGGYWQEQIPLTDNPVCAALDPAADFRWHPLNCGGPEVASFICQLEVPSWARKEDGCMLTSLPSLTVSYLPEQGAVELISDCGLEGTRRIACKGQANRDEMIKQLSCDSSTEGQTEATSSNTWDNELPTRHRRDTEVTVAMASSQHLLPTTEGLTEFNSVEVTNGSPPAKELRESLLKTTEDTDSTSTQGLPVEMTAAEEPIKSSVDILRVDGSVPILNIKNSTKEIKEFGDSIIEIPLNSIAKISSEETGNSQSETKQGGERRIVMVPSKPIPPSLRGNSPFIEPTSIPNKTEVGDQTTQKPLEKESHEVFRESKVNIPVTPEKHEPKAVNFPPLSIYKVNDDRDPDESSSRISHSGSIQKDVTDIIETTVPPKEQEKHHDKDDSKFFTRVVVEEAITTTVGPVSVSKTVNKLNTDNDFFIVTENPLKIVVSSMTKITPSPIASTSMPKTTKTSAVMDSSADSNTSTLPPDMELADEAEPEAPERPNRGRLLIRPQHHSFYPYFLNRVLG